MSNANQNTLFLLLPTEVIGEGLIEHELIEIRFEHFLDAIHHMVAHDGVVMDPEHRFFAFACELDEPSAGLTLVRSSSLDETLYPQELPPFLLVPDQETDLGFKYSEFLQELTHMKEDCCLALLDAFFNFDGDTYSKISGEIYLLEDNRLVAQLNYKPSDEPEVLAMIKNKGIDVHQYRISVDIAESLAENSATGYSF